MPILMKPSEVAPLSQGDILSGIRLYSTASNWDDGTEPGGSAEYQKSFRICLVLSRPCVLAHKSSMLVAAVHSVQEPPLIEGEVTFEKVKDFLTTLRDGIGSPDRFYLGSMPHEPRGRFYAHLDSLHTVAKPPDDELRAFLQKHRIASLTQDFVRDLHVRWFSAISSLGFDDVGWLSDHDLNWMLEIGRKELLNLQQKSQDVRVAQSSAEASGEQRHKKQIENEQRNLEKLEREIDEFRKKLAPYAAEAESRKQHQPMPSGAYSDVDIVDVGGDTLEGGERLI